MVHMVVDVPAWLDIFGTMLSVFDGISAFFSQRIGDWLPDRIDALPFGDVLATLVSAFLNASSLGDLTILSLMIGSGLTIFVIYTFVTWVLNVVT